MFCDHFSAHSLLAKLGRAILGGYALMHADNDDWSVPVLQYNSEPCMSPFGSYECPPQLTFLIILESPG